MWETGGADGGDAVTGKLDGFGMGPNELCDTDVVLVVVELDDAREKVKLAFVETERVDCSDRREAERCRTNP